MQDSVIINPFIFFSGHNVIGRICYNLVSVIFT